MGPPRQAEKKPRFRPPPPRWRLPVGRRAFWAGIAVGLVISAAYLVAFFTGRPSSPAANAPWGADRAHLRERLGALGLPALPQEGRALHTHEHLDLYLNGTHVAIPANVGIGPGGDRFFSPLHTHDRTGILHVESPAKIEYTLGQFFGVWGVRLSSTCIGNYCAGGSRTLSFVDGRRVQGDPATIPLRRHAEIVIAFGTQAQLPKRIPSGYSFPDGY